MSKYDLKCFKCCHAELCLELRGGADLEIAAATCGHYREMVELPKKFWIVFDVPGFYNIVEYDVDRVSYAGGKLDRLWGHHGNNKETVYRADFLRTVFFTEQGAKDGLEALIEERRQDEAGRD